MNRGVPWIGCESRNGIHTVETAAVELGLGFCEYELISIDE